MTSTKAVTAADKDALKALYDEAVAEINVVRGSNTLTSDFYARTGAALFEAGCLALSDAITDMRRMHTVSAPAGGGKTSFAYALVAAVTRYAEHRPEAPYGSVFVVGEIEKADQVYRDLNDLLPGKVAVWTTDHDRGGKEPEKIKEPAKRFDRNELRHFPVIVVTHNFYLKTNGHYARDVMRNGVSGVRALTLVDEKPDEAPMIEVELSEAQKVRKSLLEAQPETKEHLDALLSFMERYSYAAANKLYRPGIEENLSELTQKLGWFKTKEASLVAKSGGSSAENLFAFARALVLGRACVYTNGPLPCFFGYEENRVVDLTAGTVLLDATADIDGVSSIVPWRAATETPKARYDNLEIIHVPQHTRKNLSTYLKKATNQRDYVNWVKATITQYVQSGQKAFVVCKKCLFDNERIPTWPQGDPRFKEPKLYTEKFEWDLEGRKLCATHWGSGIGSNAWMKADVVLLFDEYIPPRRSSVAQTQGLRGHKVYEGDLGGMSTLNSKAPAVDSISEGHVLRWTKQLALRGNARNYDKDGVCGKQRLVVGSNLKRFMANVEMLFPKAKLVRVGSHSDRSTYGEQILAMLSTTRERLLSTKVISNLIGKPWRNVLPFVRTPAFLRSLKTLGWQYKSLRGRGGAQFERLVEVSC